MLSAGVFSGNPVASSGPRPRMGVLSLPRAGGRKAGAQSLALVIELDPAPSLGSKLGRQVERCSPVLDPLGPLGADDRLLLASQLVVVIRHASELSYPYWT